ncbi:Regulatory protein AtoC [bioreactor metagenome]|uniref:Regulatory protein AtoC n=1 Tax=bioreactor metagenome TaxID=1076179 RepID=A0A645JFV3_9ZZZZ
MYFRLNVVEIKVPSLRERKQDLPLLFNYYIQKYNKELNRNVKGVSKEVENVLIKYDYPGNIRELSNIFENMIVFTNSEIIEIENVPKIVREYKSIIKNTESFTAESLIGMNIKEIEKIVIKLTLQKNGNSRKITADMLGISERGLRNKILEYGLK